MTDTASCGVGEALSQARASRGLALADVAQQLKFAPRHIEALEEERFDALPGGTFARGMVRSYARLLKLDPEPLLESLAGRFESPDSQELAARFSQPVPFSDSGRRSTLMYLGLSVGVLLFVAFAAYQWRREGVAPEGAPAAAPALAAVPVAPQPPAPAVAKRVEPPPPPPPPSPSPREIAKAVPPASAPVPIPAKLADAPKKSAAGGRIVLRCEEESWIEVKDSAERTLISSLNAAGTERVVEGRPPFTLVIGNAQHVRVSYNNEPVDLAPHTKVEVARFILQ